MKRNMKAILAGVMALTVVFSGMTSAYAKPKESRGINLKQAQGWIMKQQQLQNQQLKKQQQLQQQQLRKQQQLEKQQQERLQQLQKQQFQQAKHKEDDSDENSDDNSFSDVNKNFWAYQAIMNLYNRGIITGYSDKTFKPDEKVTRAQFAIMLTRALKLKATDNTQKFADVDPKSWYFNEVQASENYLTGYQTANGTLYFYGDKDAVREDMAVALVKALNVPVENDNGQLQQVFSDYNDISAKLRDYINTAYKDGIMMGSEGKFVPQGTLTRASAAALLERALEKTEKVPPQDNGQKVVVGGTTTPVSGTDATLRSLTWNGTAVTGFNANTLTYNVSLPAGTTAIPVVAAVVNDTGKASAVITQAASLPGNASVIVTAQDGKTQKVYSISFTVAPVTLNTDATLSSLTWNGTAVTGFNANTLAYNVSLPTGTTVIPVVAAVVNDTGKAAAVITQAAGLPGNASVIVTAQDGKTQKVYSISFTVAPVALNTDASLSSLSYSGMVVPSFNPATLAYNVILPYGTTVVPVVTAAVNDTGKATAFIAQATALPGNASVTVTAQDGKTQKLYIISFTVAAPNTDATLSGITYNGTAVAGFNPNTLTYNVVLPAGTAIVPAVAAAVNDTGKAAAIITQAPSLPGFTSILVTAQDGKTQKVYFVNFSTAVQ